jgi:hypothetical protein
VAINPVPRPATRWQDPEFHKEYENRATEIIRSSETQNTELCLIAPEAMNYTRRVEPAHPGDATRNDQVYSGFQRKSAKGAIHA